MRTRAPVPRHRERAHRSPGTREGQSPTPAAMRGGTRARSLDTVSGTAVASPSAVSAEPRAPPQERSGMSRLIYGWLTAAVAGLPPRLGYLLADALTEVHFRMFPARRH